MASLGHDRLAKPRSDIDTTLDHHKAAAGGGCLGTIPGQAFPSNVHSHNMPKEQSQHHGKTAKHDGGRSSQHVGSNDNDHNGDTDAGQETGDDHDNYNNNYNDHNEDNHHTNHNREIDSNHDNSYNSHNEENDDNDDNDDENRAVGRRFRALAATRRSRRTSYLKLLGQWATSLVFVIAVYAVVVGYSNKSVVTKAQKRQFNALVTGLLIALGLSTASLLTDLAKDLRWWILSRRYRSRRKVEDILQAHSVRRVVMLSARSSRASIHVVVASWVLLILASQIGFASVNLCYTFETSETKALLSPGNVFVANVSDIETANIVESSTSPRAQQYTAHSFGILSLGFDMGSPDDKPTPGDLWYSDDPLVFCDANYCQYVFHETNPERTITVSTNRIVNATTQCESWPVVAGGSGTEANITISLAPGQFQTVFLPIQGGPDQRTYMTDTGVDCGHGCGIVTAFEASDTSPWFYRCNTTVGIVENASRAEHHMGENLSRLASVAIALQGYPTVSSSSSSSSSSPSPLPLLRRDYASSVQSVIFPSQSAFGVPLDGSTAGMAFLLSRFAIGVVGIAAENNDMIVVPGNVPTAGVKLRVHHWQYIHVILLLAVGLQLLLGLVAEWLANKVVVPRGGPVAEAQVVRAMVAGSTLGRSCDGAGGKGGRGKSVWIYRDVHVGNGVYDLYMEEKVVSAERGQPGQVTQIQEKPGAQSTRQASDDRGELAGVVQLEITAE